MQTQPVPLLPDQGLSLGFQAEERSFRAGIGVVGDGCFIIAERCFAVYGRPDLTERGDCPGNIPAVLQDLSGFYSNL